MQCMYDRMSGVEPDVPAHALPEGQLQHLGSRVLDEHHTHRITDLGTRNTQPTKYLRLVRAGVGVGQSLAAEQDVGRETQHSTYRCIYDTCRFIYNT